MNSEILDQLPPHNTAAEKSVIGSALLEPKIVPDLAGILKPDDFYIAAHVVIFSHMVGMARTNNQIDQLLLIDQLRAAGDLERIDGVAALAEIVGAVAVPNHFRHYAELVRRDSRKRQLFHATTEQLRAAYDSTVTPEDAIRDAEERLAAIQTGNYDTELVTMLDAAVAAIGELQAGRRPGYMTGLQKFDEQIGGFFTGELVILGARPSQGKTSLALQAAAHIASRGRKVYFATLEMSSTELATKRLCSVAGVSQHSIRTGTITPDDQRRLVAAGSEVGVPNLLLHDWPEIRPHDIQRAARRFGADVIFVDYLQIVSPPDQQKKRYEQVGDISRVLKAIARQMDVPVVACAQLGRQADQHESRPKLSHLRESGNIENDADMVLLLWRPEDGIDGGEQFANDHWAAELEVAKNRKGVRGRFRLDWDGELTSFSCHGPQVQRRPEFDKWST